MAVPVNTSVLPRSYLGPPRGIQSACSLQLTSIDLSDCDKLTALPEGLFGGLAALTSVKVNKGVATPKMLEDLRARGVEVSWVLAGETYYLR